MTGITSDCLKLPLFAVDETPVTTTNEELTENVAPPVGVDVTTFPDISVPRERETVPVPVPEGTV